MSTRGLAIASVHSALTTERKLAPSAGPLYRRGAGRRYAVGPKTRSPLLDGVAFKRLVTRAAPEVTSALPLASRSLDL
jgi:hypothetical protein